MALQLPEGNRAHRGHVGGLEACFACKQLPVVYFLQLGTHICPAFGLVEQDSALHATWHNNEGLHDINRAAMDKLTTICAFLRKLLMGGLKFLLSRGGSSGRESRSWAFRQTGSTRKGSYAWL